MKMKKSLIALLALNLAVLGNVIIEKDATFITVAMPNESSETKEKNLLIFTRWEIPKNENTTLSNFIQHFDINVHQLDKDTLDRARSFIYSTNSGSQDEKELKKILENINRTSKCILRTKGRDFLTIKVDHKSGGNVQEVALSGEMMETNGSEVLLGFGIYSNTLIFDSENKEFKTMESKGGMKSGLFVKSKFLVTPDDSLQKLDFDGINVFEDVNGYTELVYKENDETGNNKKLKHIADFYKSLTENKTAGFKLSYIFSGGGNSQRSVGGEVLFLLDYLDKKNEDLDIEEDKKSLKNIEFKKEKTRIQTWKNKGTEKVYEVYMTRPTDLDKTNSVVMELIGFEEPRSEDGDKKDENKPVDAKEKQVKINKDDKNDPDKKYDKKENKKGDGNMQVADSSDVKNKTDDNQGKQDSTVKKSSTWLVVLVVLLLVALLGAIGLAYIKYNRLKKGKRFKNRTGNHNVNA
eukprot:GAHX01001070.1.p1 GENE.GAHX01001070.1~~GAHX01001070.1.p1  ORF type:complete len:465 (+),score=92.54 GAHX01001070.1:1444-2838(+)